MIWTDSAIALQSIKCYCQNTYTGEIFKLKADSDQERRILERIVEAVQQLYPIRVTMRKVGAHRGIRGNEIADRLARIGRVQPVPIHVYHDVGRKVIPAIDEEAACIDRILKLDHQLLLDNTSASFSESCRDSTNRASEIDDTGANWCLTKQKRLSSLLSPKPSIRDMESDWRLTKQKISLSRRLLLPKSSSITANYENLSLRPQTAQTPLLCSV
ncbi:hypothetical protein KP509_1Z129400 [Ceratopteris richardii]|nr:hypothetical protein KP509_1Z129400 [Ceratopteris richardii]